MYKRIIRLGTRQSKEICLQTGKEENLVAVQFTRLDALVGPIWPQKPGRYLDGVLVLGPPWKAKMLSLTAASGRVQAGVHFPFLMPRLSEVVPAAQMELPALEMSWTCPTKCLS